tara:strand:+ start:742 stop:1536 length:795 start_codon:yes stop_codon:yes gene_type:complete
MSKNNYLDPGTSLQFTGDELSTKLTEATAWSNDNNYGEIRAQWAIKRLNVNYNFETVLDIGCGPKKHGHIFESCGKKVIYNDMRKVWDPTILGNILDVQDQIPDNSIDCIWASHVLEHQPNAAEFLRLLKKKLKHNGILAITVPPLKHQIVGGHVSLWNMGLLFYNLVAVGFNCSSAIGRSYSYDISVIVRKNDINWNQNHIKELNLEYSSIDNNGVLTADGGDFYKLKPYFPELTWTKHGIDESFPGDIINKNWDGVPDGKIL